MAKTITFTSKGKFKKTDKFFERILNGFGLGILDKYGKMGVEALKNNTPVDSGTTASSWYYTIENTKNGLSIVWNNSNSNEGVHIAIILQYGHGTSSGAYVEGIDYINPAIKPIFEDLADEAWKELIKK